MRVLVLALVLALTPGAAAADEQGGAVVRFPDPAITEASGLVDLGDLLVTTNDSGSGPVLFVVDARTGRTVGRTTYTDAVTDVEALAPGPAGSVWVGDIGDNVRGRRTVRVHQVPRVRPGDHRTASGAVELVYPDGPHDAESLFTGPDGRMYVVAKGLLGGGIYRTPEAPSPGHTYRLRRVGGVSIFATDAAAFPGSDLVVVRGYGSAQVLDLAIGGRRIGSFPLPRQPQGEAISVGPGDRILVTSEGRHAAVLRVRPPAWLGPRVASSRRTTSAVAGVGVGAMLGR